MQAQVTLHPQAAGHARSRGAGHAFC